MMSASLRSAANLYEIFGENEMLLSIRSTSSGLTLSKIEGSIRAKEIFHSMEQTKTPEVECVLNALNFIIPTLQKYNFKWVITGGFASLVHGVNRSLTDIDIDINTSRNSTEFKNFLKDVEQFTTQPLEHFVDQNYDNYNFEISYEGQVLDICPMAEMNIFDKSSGKYENFYKDGFPEIEFVDFHGLELPLLSKELIIKNKEMLVWQRESDHRDVAGLRELLKSNS